jgi:hypothetical protein
MLSDFVHDEAEGGRFLDLLIEVANICEDVLCFVGGCVLDVEVVEKFLDLGLISHSTKRYINIEKEFVLSPHYFYTILFLFLDVNFLISLNLLYFM